MGKKVLVFLLTFVCFLLYPPFGGAQASNTKASLSRSRANFLEKGRPNFDKFVEFEQSVEKSVQGSTLNSFLAGIATISNEFAKGNETKWNTNELFNGYKAAVAAVPIKSQLQFKTLFMDLLRIGTNTLASANLLGRVAAEKNP